MPHDPLPATGLVTFLPTADLDATDAFYGGLLGLPLVRDKDVCRIYRASPGSGAENGGGYWGFCDRGYAVAEGVRVVLTLLVDDVEAAHRELVARGAVPEGPPAHHERYAVTSFFVRDPNGYFVEFQRFDVPVA
jgi:catechol 2,3-dioxygenase-like lactoylglutathione lyase family enzyme